MLSIGPLLARALAAREIVIWPVIAVAVSLSACSSSVENWEEVRPQRQPEVQFVDHHHTVQFSGGSTRLSRGEAQRLNAFLAQAGTETGNMVAVSPRLDSATSSARANAAMSRANAVSRYLRARGLDPSIVATTAVPGGSGTLVDVLVRQYLVSLPECPDWTDRPGWNFGNLTSSNWGCATAVNLGVMVADPGDLVHGAGGQPASAELLAMSIERYRTDKVKELMIETTTEAFSEASSGSGQ